jgi:hypothetical protein
MSAAVGAAEGCEAGPRQLERGEDQVGATPKTGSCKFSVNAMT